MITNSDKQDDVTTNTEGLVPKTLLRQNQLNNTFFKIVKLVKDTSTGVTEIKKKEGLVKIFPNPSDGIFEIRFNSSTDILSLQIFNSIGQKVFTQSSIDTKKTLQLSLADLPEGIYFIQIFTKEGVQMRKFVVAK